MNHPISIGTEKNLLNAIDRAKVRCEETTIMAVLKVHLGRDATFQDASLCTQKLSEPWNGSYRLFYKGEELGVIRYTDTPQKFRVEFEPLQIMN